MSFIQKGLKWITEMQPATAQKTVLAMAQPCRVLWEGKLPSDSFLVLTASRSGWPSAKGWAGQTQRARPTVHWGHALGQRAGQGGRPGRQGTRAVPWPSAHKNGYISDSEHVPGATQRQLCVFNHLHQHRESRGLALNEWVAQDWKGHCPRKPGGNRLISQGMRGQNADVYIVKSQRSIFLLCHNSHIMTIIPFWDRNIFISS